jgi:two-component system response regulator
MSKVILLVEDNASDEKLTILAFKKCGVANEVAVVRDGATALDYLFGTGKHADRDLRVLPSVVLLDLKLPKVDGLEVLRRIRADERTKFLPVVVLTSSKEDEDVFRSYSLGANAYVRKPVAFAQFAEAAKTLGLFWLLLNMDFAPPLKIGRKDVAPSDDRGEESFVQREANRQAHLPLSPTQAIRAGVCGQHRMDIATGCARSTRVRPGPRSSRPARVMITRRIQAVRQRVSAT